MNGHADAEGQGPVVQHVDGKEHRSNESPSLDRNFRRTERVGTSGRELGRVGCGGGEEELKEGNEKA